jgi:hypothetical protein
MEELEYEILDALYFVEPFNTIVDEVSEKRIPVIKDCLRQLINKQYIKVMVWDNTEKTFVSSPFIDFDTLEDFHFLITRQGLLAHNTRAI